MKLGRKSKIIANTLTEANGDNLFSVVFSFVKKNISAPTRWSLFVFVALAVSTAISITPAQPVSAATPIDEMSLESRAKAFVQYKALEGCLITGAYKNSVGLLAPPSFVKGWTMSASNAVGYDWFHGWKGVIPLFLVPAGVADPNHVDVGVIIDSSDGVMNCGDEEGRQWIGELIRTWGYSSGPELLCELGFGRSVNQSNCQEIVPGAENDFHAPGGILAPSTVPVNLTTLWKETLGASSTGVESIGAGEYELYLASFKAACKVISPGSGDYEILERNPATNTLEPVKYGVGDQNVGTGHSVKVYRGFTATCAQLAAELGNPSSRSVLAMEARLINHNPDDETGGPNDNLLCAQEGIGCPDDSPTCGNQVAGVGWILCPVLSGLAGMNDGMWNLASSLLKVDPLTDELQKAWGSLRQVANVAFIIIFMIMVFSQLTSVGIGNYGIKKLLPRLIIGAILVNLSFYVVALAVDLANILGSSLYDVIVGLSTEFNPSEHGWEVLINLITQSIAGAGLAVAGVALAGGSAAVFWMLLPLAAMGALSFIAAILTLIFRQAIIPVLAILAPIAFVLYLLPNTEQWYKKWQGLLLSMLMLYPLAAIVFGGVQFAAMSVINSSNGEDWWGLLIGLVMLTLPLFALPFIARQGGTMLTSLSGALSGFGKKLLSKPISDYAGARAETSRSGWMAKQGRGINLGRRAMQRMNRNRRARDLQKEVNESTMDAAWAGRTVTDPKLASLKTRQASNQAAINAANAPHQAAMLQGLASGGSALKSALGAAGDNEHVADAIAEAVSDATEKSIKAAEIKARAEIAPGNLAEMGSRFAEAVRAGDDVRASALQGMLLGAGSSGIKQWRSNVEDLEGKGEMSAGTAAGLRRRMISANPGMKQIDAAADAWATQGVNLKQARADTEVWSGLTNADFAGQKSFAQMDAISAGAINQARAHEISNNAQIFDTMDEKVKAEIRRIANSSGGGGIIKPGDEGFRVR